MWVRNMGKKEGGVRAEYPCTSICIMKHMKVLHLIEIKNVKKRGQRSNGTAPKTFPLPHQCFTVSLGAQMLTVTWALVTNNDLTLHLSNLSNFCEINGPATFSFNK